MAWKRRNKRGGALMLASWDFSRAHLLINYGEIRRQCGAISQRASHIWQSHWGQVLKEAGWVRGVANPACTHHPEQDASGVVHSDDFLVAADREAIDQMSQLLEEKYEVKMTGCITLEKGDADASAPLGAASSAPRVGSRKGCPNSQNDSSGTESSCRYAGTEWFTREAVPIPGMRIAYLSLLDRADLLESVRHMASRMKEPRELRRRVSFKKGWGVLTQASVFGQRLPPAASANPRESHRRLRSRQGAATAALHHRSIHHARQPLSQRTVKLAKHRGFVIGRERVLRHRQRTQSSRTRTTHRSSVQRLGLRARGQSVGQSRRERGGTQRQLRSACLRPTRRDCSGYRSR
eukprot:1415190-Amphidinium_carterae.2